MPPVMRHDLGAGRIPRCRHSPSRVAHSLTWVKRLDWPSTRSTRSLRTFRRRSIRFPLACGPDQRKGNGALYSALAGAVERFKIEFDAEDQERFRSDLDAFIRAYSFLSQIVTWTDNDLEKLYVWAKSLLSNLPKRANDGSLDLGAEVELTHLRIEKSAEVDTSLAGTQAEDEPLSALPGAGGASADPQTERLSAIIDRLNERHALNLTITDALLFEQFKGDWVADPELAAQARANTFDNFLIVFAKKFLTTVLSRMDANADIFKAINDDKGFAEDLKASYGREVYLALRDAHDLR